MEPFGLRPGGIEIAEGVSELWICSPMRAKEKNGSPQDGANAGFPKGGMAHTATAPISGAGENTARHAPLSLSRDRRPRRDLVAGVVLARASPTAQRRVWIGP